MKKSILKYLIEFLIIVLGISISFYIQQRTKEKDNKIKQREGLLRILEDLKSDEFIFKLTLSTNNKQIEAANEILSGNINEENYNIIIPYFGTFLNDTSIKSLMSTGTIDGYNNQHLITEILKYYRNDYDFIIDQSQADESLMFRRLNYVVDHIQIDSVSHSRKTDFGDLKMPHFYISNLELKKLEKDPVYKGFLNNLIYIKISYNYFVNNGLKKNESLQESIKKEVLHIK